MKQFRARTHPPRSMVMRARVCVRVRVCMCMCVCVCVAVSLSYLCFVCEGQGQAVDSLLEHVRCCDKFVSNTGQLVIVHLQRSREVEVGVEVEIEVRRE